MSFGPEFTWILPAHNEAGILEGTIARIRELARARGMSRARAVLVENGSTDATWELCQRLERERSPELEVKAVRSPDKGIGFAYALGIRTSCEIAPNSWLILSAADLPFGFTDLKGFFGRVAAGPRVIIGSKRHAESQVQRGFVRSLMTWVFFQLRRCLIGLSVGDTQGTVCLPAAQAGPLLQRTVARDFFFSTELLYRAHQARLPIEEVPIVLEPELRPTTVRAWRDSRRMLGQLWRLRRSG